MAQTIKLKRSASSGAVPTTSSLELGEVAINTHDGKMYIKKNDGSDSVVEVGGTATQQTAIWQPYAYTATSNQTTFTGSDDNSRTMKYIVGYLEVYVNGLLLDPSTDYTATNGVSIVLATAASASDLVQINTFVKVAGTGDITLDTFTGNGLTVAYTLSVSPGSENNTQVYVNAVYQNKDTYTVSGTTLTFDTAPVNNAEIEVTAGSRNVSFTDVNDLTISGDLVLADTKKLKLGDSSDLEIYHDTSNSIIRDNGAGHIQILSGTVTVGNAALSKTSALFSSGGAQTLYYDNDPKFVTSSAGIGITGNIAVSGTVDGVDIATRDGILTSTTTTAGAALPKAGGAMTGAITTNSTFDGRDVATDGTKLDGIEVGADVTDTANVTSSGALMDSEVTNLAQVKAFDSSDYATAAQGTTANAALPKAGGTMTGTLAMGANAITSTGTLSSGAITSSAHTIYTQASTLEGINLVANVNSANQNSDSPKIQFNGEYQTNGPYIYGDNIGSYGYKSLKFYTNRNSATDYTTAPTVTLTLDSSGNAQFTGTISSGAITTSGNVTALGSVTSTGLTAKVAQTANTVMEVAKITTSGSYSSSGSSGAGGALTFGQYDDTYPAWNLSQIASVRNGSGWNGDLVFYINNGTSQTSIYERMRLSSNGNLNLTNGSLMVGATTAPLAKSHIKDTGWSSGAPYGTVQLIEGNNVNDNNWGHLVITDSSTANGNGGSIRFATGAGGASTLNPFSGVSGISEGTSWGGLGFFTRPQSGTATERMSIDSAGTVDVANDLLANNAKLKAIAESNTDTAIDVFVYDTRKDSDGGAWRKRTQHTSWYNEALNTATRGARKQFPSVAVIVASVGRVTIYDGDDPDMPMWMVFPPSGILDWPTSTLTDISVTALNGQIVTGANDGGLVWKFISDYIDILYNGNFTITSDRTIAGRSDTTSYTVGGGNNFLIVNHDINDVAMTVLPNAPIDADTRLPVPTIAVATTAGVSVIKDDGSVVDITSSTYTTFARVKFVGNLDIAYANNNTAVWYLSPIPNTDTAYSAYNDKTGNVNRVIYGGAYSSPEIVIVDNNDSGYSTRDIVAQNRTEINLQTRQGLNKVYRNISNEAEGLNAVIKHDYNTGWMNGDIKLATLSDTDTTNAVGTELVTNGTFASTKSPWAGGDWAWQTGGWLRKPAGTASTTYQTGTGIVYVGQKYNITFTVGGRTAGAVTAYLGSAAGTSRSANGTYSQTITCAGDTILRFTGDSAFDGYIDDVSVRLLAEADRSVNNNGLQVFGTVTKTAVATGAELVSYGPFSTSNYLATTI